MEALGLDAEFGSELRTEFALGGEPTHSIQSIQRSAALIRSRSRSMINDVRVMSSLRASSFARW